MKVKIFLIFLFMFSLGVSLSVYASLDKELLIGIDFNYDGETIVIDNIYNLYGYRSNLVGSDYVLSIIDSNGESLYESNFGIPDVSGSPSPNWFDEKGKQLYFPKKDLNENPIQFTLLIPYIRGADKLIVKDSDLSIVIDEIIEDYLYNDSFRKKISEQLDFMMDYGNNKNVFNDIIVYVFLLIFILFVFFYS